MPQDVKDLKQRLDEAITLRTQLQRLGVLAVDQNATKFKRHSNDFIRGAIGSRFNLKLSDTSRVVVSFCIASDIKSGISVEL